MTTSDEAFCHDHIEHPLMWCDEKRRLVERKNAEESMRMWRRRKTEEMARKEKDKQEYYELMVKHCPWGKPGGGAPNIDVRRKDITAAGLHSTQPISTTHRLASLPPCRFSDYFLKHKRCFDPMAAYHPHHYHHHSVPRLTTHTHTVQHVPDRPVIGGATSMVTLCDRDIPTTATSGGGAGGGAPAVGGKNAESLHITLKDHPSMSFRNKGHVDIEVRYKPTAADVGKTQHCPAAVGPHGLKQKKTLEKIEKPASKDPWGKPGPGGKPWRSPKSVGTTFMKSLGWTNKEMLKDLDQDNPVTPAEKPTFRKSRATRKATRCCDMCTCKCPAMTSSPIKPLQKPPAPAKTTASDAKPKICPRLMRHNKPAATADTTTDNSAHPTNRQCGDTTTITTNGNGVELVPLLARRRAHYRPISLSTTDITKRTASNDRYASKMPQKCHHSNICLNKNISSNNNNNNNNNNSNNHKLNNIATTTCCLKKFTLHIR
ncbi:uncharacterized protein LOC101892239 isoform X2 [Musca domestica]|uniref:Uncharacterized protein LOC101892239 isoform X2 n=1 Tax=Musca domestica TaxID=7370 RepID=A0ABM3URX0_MUSDO|nr:uncharacterized protein LOC101892239 isoform X2 [Musca domestica]